MHLFNGNDGVILMKKHVLYSAVLSCAVLSACGGGSGGSGSSSGSSSGGTGTPSQTAPGGIYLGYYAEDPKTNPEDPTLGAFVLNMPSSNTSFSGAMFFTYVGCQSENVGVVSGNKTDAGIAGNWSGSLDGVMNTGSYTGSWQAATQSYSGTFTNAGGKQFRDLRPCIQYYIAPNGSFEMFAAEKLIPDTFQISLSGRTLSWSNVNGSTIALVRASGAIVSGRASDSPFDEEALANAEDVVDALESAASTPDVKAIVFRIDSPGGTYPAADAMADAVAQIGRAHV